MNQLHSNVPGLKGIPCCRSNLVVAWRQCESDDGFGRWLGAILECELELVNQRSED